MGRNSTAQLHLLQNHQVLVLEKTVNNHYPLILSFDTHVFMYSTACLPRHLSSILGYSLPHSSCLAFSPKTPSLLFLLDLYSIPFTFDGLGTLRRGSLTGLMKMKASTCLLVTDKHLENSGICIDHLKGGTCNLIGLSGYVFGHEVASEKI